MPFSCDTFVALPPVTSEGCVVFGKNSDRPSDEVQEVIHCPAKDYSPGTSLSCTYIDIPQSSHTHAVILSKPAWMWGAEIGANEHGVTIGNEAVWTRLTRSGKTFEEKLLGMDYVRLGLERSTSARNALDIMTDLLRMHGQGGRCFENEEWGDITYCNSFIIADRHEAWVLETAGRHWAAEKVDKGTRNISNLLSIGVKIDAMSDDLLEFAEEKGLWNSEEDGQFNFSEAFSSCRPSIDDLPEKGTPEHRFKSGKKLLEKLSENNEFDAKSMFTILRDKDSGICRCDISVSVGSQVSVLLPHDDRSKVNSQGVNSISQKDVHWFTATPDPSLSIYKPFVFVDGVDVGQLTVSPDYGLTDPVKSKPRFRKTVDRRHSLYKAHEIAFASSSSGITNSSSSSGATEMKMEKIKEGMKKLENKSIETVFKYLSFDSNSSFSCHQIKTLFKSAVESEIDLYDKMK